MLTLSDLFYFFALGKVLIFQFIFQFIEKTKNLETSSPTLTTGNKFMGEVISLRIFLHSRYRIPDIPTYPFAVSLQQRCLVYVCGSLLWAVCPLKSYTSLPSCRRASSGYAVVQAVLVAITKTGSADSCPKEAEPRNSQEISLGAGLTPATRGR